MAAWVLRWLSGVLLVSLGTTVDAGGVVLIPRGAPWRYHDTGGNLPAGWAAVNFDDSSWASGPAPLGYGHGDEATVIDRAGRKPITTYFRHTFTNSIYINNLTLRIRRNDAAAIYLNGAEHIRSRLPAGTITGATLATTPVTAEEDAEYVQYGIFVWFLPDGPNTLAIEVHQAADGTNDCILDAELIANLPIEPPAVALVSPTNQTVFAEAEPILLSGIATDSDGHILNVSFYTNNVLLGSDTEAPYRLAWTNAVSGRYFVHAVAKDNHNRVAASDKVHIQVGGPLPDALVRGPYLQAGTPTNIVVCWRTDWYTDSRVRYGTAPGDLSEGVDDPRLLRDHEIALTGLRPNSRYYFSVGTSTGLTASSPDYYFVTAPTSAVPVRVWAIGDTRTGDAGQRAVRDAYKSFAGIRPTDLWVLLGDQTANGTDEHFQVLFFEVYSNLLTHTVVWPCRGNHEADPAYFDVFSPPSRGEAGGVPSESESWYSFDFANTHWVVLDSSYSDTSTNGPMYRWLERDLAANTNDWLIAVWHAPPYTKGSHDSDWEWECVVMRTNFVPLLESHGVDLVMGGHSHSYERSYLLDGHYGRSETMVPTMLKNGGDGRPEGDGAYYKLRGPRQGAVYVVAGSGGALEGGTFDHPAMYFSKSALGSLVLDIEGNTLAAKFLRETGAIDDAFTIVKVDPEEPPRMTGIRYTSGTVRLTWACVPNRRYQVLRCEALGQPWEVIAEGFQTDGFRLSWTHQVQPEHTSFYRIERVD